MVVSKIVLQKTSFRHKHTRTHTHTLGHLF